MNYRDTVVERLKGTDVVKDGYVYPYVLTHTHDDSPRCFWVMAPYPVDTMNALVAFIQLEAFNIKETYGMDQTEAIEILTKLYECQVPNEGVESAYEIDLYLNWEMWCSSDVLSVPSFQREGLTDLLRTIIHAT